MPCQGRSAMRVEDLSGEDAAVYRAVAEAEVRVGAPHLQDIARGAGLNLDRARAAVHRLLHTEPKSHTRGAPRGPPISARPTSWRRGPDFVGGRVVRFLGPGRRDAGCRRSGPTVARAC